MKEIMYVCDSCGAKIKLQEIDHGVAFEIRSLHCKKCKCYMRREEE